MHVHTICFMWKYLILFSLNHAAIFHPGDVRCRIAFSSTGKRELTANQRLNHRRRSFSEGGWSYRTQNEGSIEEINFSKSRIFLLMWLVVLNFDSPNVDAWNFTSEVKDKLSALSWFVLCSHMKEKLQREMLGKQTINLLSPHSFFICHTQHDSD